MTSSCEFGFILGVPERLVGRAETRVEINDRALACTSRVLLYGTVGRAFLVPLSSDVCLL